MYLDGKRPVLRLHDPRVVDHLALSRAGALRRVLLVRVGVGAGLAGGHEPIQRDLLKDQQQGFT